MTAARAPKAAWSDAALGALAATLARHAGLRIAPHRLPELARAAERAMAAAGLSDPREYALRVGQGRLSMADLLGAMTVGETYFHRDPEQLELVGRRVVPEVLALRPAGHVFRAWSAGCASGEEAYSVALTLEAAGLRDRYHVLGTDLSRRSLERARDGAYGAWSLRGAAREAAARSLHREGDRWVVPPRLRARVRFEYLNLAEDVYPSLLTGTSGLDLILCRNVLMYLEPAVIAAVARRLHDCLAEGGWLLTGPADPLLAPLAPLEAISTPAGLAYRRPAGAAGSGRRAGTGPAPRRAPPAPPPPRPAPASRPPAPPPPAAVLAAAEEAGRAGDWAAVLALAAPLLELAEGAAWLVRAAANAGDLGRADALAAAATDRHPLAPELHLLRAAILAELGRDAEAAGAARRCLYLRPDLAVGHATLGGLLERAGDPEAARRAWRNVRRICAALPADAPLPLGEGRCAGRLADIAAAQLLRLDEEGLP